MKIVYGLFGLFVSGLSAFLLLACAASPYHADEIEYVKSIQPKTGKPLIIAFGDSLTGGFTLDKNKSYPRLLEERLRKNGCEYEVLNFGVNGDTTAKALTRLDEALKFDRIELFILELGANDAMQRVEIAEIRANLQKMIDRVKSRNVKILLCGFESAALDAEYRRGITEMYADLAAANDLAFVPSFLDGAAGDKKYMLPDDIHPNEEGVKIIEKKIFEKIEPLVRCGGEKTALADRFGKLCLV